MGLIAGIAVGVVVLVLAGTFGIFCWRKRRRQQSHADEQVPHRPCGIACMLVKGL